MGRFGNVYLINGQERIAADVLLGEVVRLHLVNVANTRIFNVAIPGARMKLVGGDSGRYEREEFVEAVLLAPSERAIVDVRFEHAGDARIEHRTPDAAHVIGAFAVHPASSGFDELRTDPELTAIRAGLAGDRSRAPDKVLAFLARMPLMDDVDHSPPADAHATHPGPHLEGDGLEWKDLMPGINRDSNASNMRWCVLDRETGAENHAIFWTFTVGDRVKIRLVNELESDHPMHHPFHIHGVGRFLVLARDGEIDQNLVWKDTVLVPAGQTVDILLEVTNPGRWMAHCHIAEHVESGMMFSFDVAEGILGAW